VRQIKSAAELAYLRQAAEITTDGFANLFSRPLGGRTEEEVQRELSRFMLERGADRVGFITANADTSGTYPGGYGGKTFRFGQLGNIDSGCVVRGYWADFCRNCTPGPDDSGLEDAARVMAHYVEVTHGEIRAGRTAAQVAERIGQEMRKRTNGRFPDEKTDVMQHFGHGLGLQLPEPPFLCPDDETVLRPGMVVCLKPSFIHPSAGMLIGEETVVVREDGCERLTDGASATVQVTG
jgi:Xaa-Pro dipeptidase